MYTLRHALHRAGNAITFLVAKDDKTLGTIAIAWGSMMDAQVTHSIVTTRAYIESRTSTMTELNTVLLVMIEITRGTMERFEVISNYVTAGTLFDRDVPDDAAL